MSADHVIACDWPSWERWPAEATPHHLVFVADPQLVDPHTYPGRPWPLSALTESYTDGYMARSFRLINEHLDPDSVVFLGDLLDGGREWATSKARALNARQEKYLEGMRAKKVDGVDTAGAELEKRDDLRTFVHGENGRWKKYGPRQWMEEYDRFGRIFLTPGQLYPRSERTVDVGLKVPTHPISIENGADDTETEEYAISGGKTKRVLTSLPGNHDLGFGPGVQLAVRERFETHFGEGNRVDVFGNHTFISIDAPSLAALSQFEVGGDSTEEQAESRKHIWQPAMSFISGLKSPVTKATCDYLDQLFPDGRERDVGTPKPALQGQEQLPVILLSHVPLFRDPDTDCGKMRERGRAISIAGGYQYQNVLTKTLSTRIAQQISIAGEIVHIFSGDDHDYCDVSHRWNLATGNGRSKLQNIREITVKSFSWAMGVRKPGFLLVSLWNPIDEKGQSVGTPLPTIQTHLCLLPDQLGIFLAYAQLAGVTMIILLAHAVVAAFCGKSVMDPEQEEAESELSSKLALLRSQSSSKQTDGTTNGFSTPNKSASKSRQRTASTSMTSTPAQDHQHLSVQRSYNARTRSISPATAQFPFAPSGGLVDKAGLYPQVQWADPSDDEESNVGSVGDYENDSQAKWKKRRRPPSMARRAWQDFVTSAAIVSLCAGGWYVYMVRTG